MRNGIECRKRHSLMRNRSITFSVNCPQLNLKKTKYEVYDIYEIEIGDVCRCQKIIISLYHHTIYVMSVEEESVYFLVFTVARVAGPKTGGGEGGKSEGNPHLPSLFLFESPTPFDAATPAICPTTPQAKNKTAVNVSLEIISLHSASNLRRCLSLLSET